MHLAVAASVDNAVLARLLLNLFVWQLVATGKPGWTVRRALVLGSLWGLAALSGLSAYIIPGVIVAAILWDILHRRREQERGFPWRILGHGAIMLGVASAIALPWVWHNVQVYGPADPLGIGRHIQAVAAVAPAGRPGGL